MAIFTFNTIFSEPSSLLSLVWSLSMTRIYPRPEIVFISTFDSDKTALRLKIALCSEASVTTLSGHPTRVKRLWS